MISEELPHRQGTRLRKTFTFTSRLAIFTFTISISIDFAIQICQFCFTLVSQLLINHSLINLLAFAHLNTVSFLINLSKILNWIQLITDMTTQID